MPIPELPYEQMSMYIFEHELKNYLVAVDHYSDHFEVNELEDMTVKTIIRMLQEEFRTIWSVENCA
jgi:hypothetical protein